MKLNDFERVPHEALELSEAPEGLNIMFGEYRFDPVAVECSRCGKKEAWSIHDLHLACFFSGAGHSQICWRCRREVIIKAARQAKAPLPHGTGSWSPVIWLDNFECTTEDDGGEGS